MTKPTAKKKPTKKTGSTKQGQAKMGRPPKLVDDEKTIAAISAIASVGGTQHEAAAHLGVSPRCFEEFLRTQKKARDAWDKGMGNMRLSIRRAQMKSALGGSAAMQIWLGKQYLGQKDKSETELTGKDGGPIETKQTIDVSRLSDEELAAYRLLSAAASRNRPGDQPPSMH